MCLIAGEGKILAERTGRVPDCRQAREKRKKPEHDACSAHHIF